MSVFFIIILIMLNIKQHRLNVSRNLPNNDIGSKLVSKRNANLKPWMIPENVGTAEQFITELFFLFSMMSFNFTQTFFY